MNRINKNEKVWHQFRGGTYHQIDIQHIYDNHHPYGKIARNPNCKKNLFPLEMTQDDIKRCIIRAWKVREKIYIQKNDKNILFQAVDSYTNMTLEIWYQSVNKTILTAYPIHYSCIS